MQMSAPKSMALPLKIAFGLGLGLLIPGAAVTGGLALQAQAPTPTPTAAPATTPPKLGTVKAVAGNVVTLVTDPPASKTLTITVLDGAKVQQLAVGSTDLKTATPAQLSDIAVGDRMLAPVKPGDAPESFTSSRVVLMKSGDIAQMQAAQQADWKQNGVGGIVSAIDPASGAITLLLGTKKIEVQTTAKTDFRRFARDSEKYQDAQPGKLAQIQVGDQVQARGAKSADGLSVQAVEVLSGSFLDLSGQIASVDPAADTISLRDLATKKMVTVAVTPNSDIRTMSAQMAAMFAVRQGGSAGGGRGAAAPAAGGDAGGYGGRRGGGGGAADLAQMISRMPAAKLSDLHKGDAVMIVASQGQGSSGATAITVLSGVDSILSSNPNGGMSLSMSLGGGGGGGEE
jgi:hypothetical protein